MTTDSFDLMFIQYTPRWKWFQPPMWKIFLWAYKIVDARLYKNCVPVGFSEGKRPTPRNIEIRVSEIPRAPTYGPDTVLDAYNSWLNGLKE